MHGTYKRRRLDGQLCARVAMRGNEVTSADDVIVIGGGIVGASAAYRLARSGARVTLVDRADAGQATAAGAGIISPGTSFKPPAAFFSLAFPAVAYYEELLAHLAEDGGT